MQHKRWGNCKIYKLCGWWLVVWHIIRMSSIQNTLEIKRNYAAHIHIKKNGKKEVHSSSKSSPKNAHTGVAWVENKRQCTLRGPREEKKTEFDYWIVMWIRWLHAIAMRNVEFLAISMFFFWFLLSFVSEPKQSENGFRLFGFGCWYRRLAERMPECLWERIGTKTWRGTLSQIFIWCGRFSRYHRYPPYRSVRCHLLVLLLDVCEMECNLGFNSIFNENQNYFCRAAIFRHPAKPTSMHRVTHTHAHTHCEKQLFDRPVFIHLSVKSNGCIVTLR